MAATVYVPKLVERSRAVVDLAAGSPVSLRALDQVGIVESVSTGQVRKSYHMQAVLGFEELEVRDAE